ncbi:MAG: hypothetical protein KDA51_11435, partial [Planctomycetales bacterium]|nr:hypothetical protein [Planctomycetales bacterium]
MMALGVGIALRFAAEPMAASGSPFGRQLGLASSGFQILGISSFLLNFAVTRHRESAFRGWQSIYVYSSFFWLSVVTLIEPLAFWGSHQTDPLASIQFVAERFAPLRELQFLGFAAMMIFGVALTKLSTCFNAQPSNKALGLAGFGWWTSGVLLRVGGWLWAFHNGLEGPSQRFYFAGSVCLAIGAFYIVASTRVFRKLQPVLQSHKFIRSAFGWLLFACLMLVAEPLVLASVSRPFDHAYTGAIRHAVTVGFISQMILGVGTHVVFRMRDVPDSSMPNLVPTFLLLNIGNALRVGLEVATMYTPSAFLPMGLTGFVELTGLVLWGVVIGT